MPVPNIYEDTGATHGTGALSVPWGTHNSSFCAVLVVTCAGDGTLGTPTQSGADGTWTLIASCAAGSGVGSIQIAAYWCRATSGSMSNVSVPDTGDHTSAKMFMIQNVVGSGNPINMSATQVVTTATATISMAAPATTVNNCLVFCLAGCAFDQSTSPGGSGWANASLTSVGFGGQYCTANGTGGGYMGGVGSKVTAGACGTFSHTWASGATKQANIIFAISDTATAVAYTLTAESGSVPITGGNAALTFNRSVAAASGGVPIDGQDVGLRWDRRLVADAGGVPIAGQDATLEYGGMGYLVAESGAVPIAGQDVGLVARRLLVAESGAVDIAGSDASLFKGHPMAADAGAVDITGTAAGLRVERLLVAASGAIPITGTDASLSTGDAISMGVSGIDAQPYPYASRDSLVTLDTPTSGAMAVIITGGGTTEVTQAITDNVAGAPNVYDLISHQTYPDYGGAWALAIHRSRGQIVGRTGHQFVGQVATGDENTTIVAIMPGAARLASWSWRNVANASGALALTSDTISLQPGTYVLLAVWGGAGPASYGPYTGSPARGPDFTAVARSPFTPLQSYLINWEFGEVQMATAYAVVEVTTAGTYSVTWDMTPAQGAQLPLLAFSVPASVVADGGTIQINGQDVSLKVAHKLVAESGAVDIAGQDMTPRLGLALSAQVGAIDIAGQDATLIAARRLTAESGAVDIAGQDASLALGAYLGALPGVVEIAGQDASLRATRVLTAESGAVPIAGTDAGLRRGAVMISIAGGVPIAGADVQLVVSRRLTAESGAIAIAGVDAGLSRAAIVIAAAGAVPITGSDAGLVVARRLTADGGSVALSGQDAALEWSGAGAAFTLTAESGAVPITGAAASLRWDRRMVADAGAVPIDGQDAALRFGLVMTGDAGAVPIAGQDASLRWDRRLVCLGGTIAIVGLDARLVWSGSNTTAWARARGVLVDVNVTRGAIVDVNVTRGILENTPP